MRIVIARRLSDPSVEEQDEQHYSVLSESESEYRFSSLLMRLVGLLTPGSFHKQSQQHMQDFKAFAEQGKDVREGRN